MQAADRLDLLTVELAVILTKAGREIP